VAGEGSKMQPAYVPAGGSRLGDVQVARCLRIARSSRRSRASIAASLTPRARILGSFASLAQASKRERSSPREEATDALVRQWGSAPESLQDPSEPGSRWLEALCAEPAPISASAAQLESLQRSHSLWLHNLKLAGDEHFRVAFRLSAPEEANGSWALEFALQAQADPSLLVPAGEVWRGNVSVRRLRAPQEKLLTGLGSATAWTTRT
jgi:hypothetical protein